MASINGLVIPRWEVVRKDGKVIIMFGRKESVLAFANANGCLSVTRAGEFTYGHPSKAGKSNA